jgi:hypothetical protein
MALSVFERGHATGNAGRIQPAGVVPPDGDWVLCLGHDAAGEFVRINVGDGIKWKQEADFDITKVLRFRARIKGPSNYSAFVRVVATTDTYGFDVTLPGQSPVSISYQADTNGLPVAGQTGSVASIDSFSPTTSLATVSGLTGMSEDSVGRQLEISGAASGGNNGKFVIHEYVSDTSVKVSNASAVAPDGNNGSISWTERRRDDDATTIARALVAVVNDDDVEATAKHLVDGVLQVSPDDLDADIVIDSGLPNTTYIQIATAPRWQAIFSIDGTSHATLDIDPRRTRELYDMATQVIYLTPGDHVLRFELSFDSQSVDVPSGGPFEVELPSYHVDALVFDEAT